MSSLISFNSEEEKAYMIIQRKKLRILYNDCCQKIINLNFKFYQLRRTVSDSINTHEYAALKKQIHKETELKIIIKRKIEELTMNSDMDKLADLECKLRENLSSIYSNLSKLKENKAKIKKMKSNQDKLLENIEDCIKITAN
jgi:hypothetical protein